jgi:hypothetical protein
MTAALAALQGGKRQALARYLNRELAIPLPGLAALVREARAVEHCTTLTAGLHADSRARLRDDPGVPPSVQHAATETWQFMTVLHDPASPRSRIYLRARPDLTAEFGFSPGQNAQSTCSGAARKAG